MTSQELFTRLLPSGMVGTGDILDISSDYASLYFYTKKIGLPFDGNDLLDFLYSLVTDAGTLMVRTFSWDFCKGIGFDLGETKSQVGELGNIALGREDFKRTRHPIYSWMVKGRFQDELCSLDNKTSFGKDSPWSFLEKKDAKMLILGNTGTFGLTCLHYIEQEIGINYRYEKDFHAPYIDESGESSEKTYSMYVRKLDRQILFNKDAAWRRLCTSGAMQTEIVDGYFSVACMSYKKACQQIRNDFSLRNISDWVTIKPLED